MLWRFELTVPWWPGATTPWRKATVPTGLANVIGIAAGANHSLALVRSERDRCGLGRQFGWCAEHPSRLNGCGNVASGDNHCLALKADGRVAALGYSYFGQTAVPPTCVNVVAIAGGAYHSMALRADGQVVTWGTYPDGYTPMDVPPGLANVVAIAAGAHHCLALRAGGTVTAWGYNVCGQTNVPAGLDHAVAIGGGTYWSLALKADGTVILWGAENLEGPVTA